MIEQAKHDPQVGMIIEYGYSGERGVLRVVDITITANGSKQIHYYDSCGDEGDSKGMLYLEGGWTLLLTRVVEIRNVYYDLTNNDWEV